MTTRHQILRSSTPGQVPTAGARLPGELWTTFPDLQLGVIDASKNAQKLIAVRFFSTTANYAAGDFVIQAGVLYAAKASITAGAFNATQWARLGSATDPSGPYLALAGGTLTGDLVLNRDPQVALGAATRQYVDGKVSAAPFLPIAGGTLTGPVILSGPPTIPLHAATKAYVDAGAFVPIGGGTMTGDLILNRDPQVALGATTKQYVDVLPRAMNDNRIINGNFAINQRAYVSGTALAAAAYGIDRWKAGAGGCTYTFTAALPDTTITISTGTLTQVIEAGMIEGGVYVLSWTGTAQARVYQGTPTGSYAASPLTTASLTAGTNTVVEFNAGTVTRVKLEIGSVATPFNRHSLAKSMADCQRYYTFGIINLGSYGAAGATFIAHSPLKTTMRAAPTTTVSPITATNCSAFAIVAVADGQTVNFSGTISALGGYQAQASYTAAAEL